MWLRLKEVWGFEPPPVPRRPKREQNKAPNHLFLGKIFVFNSLLPDLHCSFWSSSWSSSLDLGAWGLANFANFEISPKKNILFLSFLRTKALMECWEALQKGQLTYSKYKEIPMMLCHISLYLPGLALFFHFKHTALHLKIPSFGIFAITESKYLNGSKFHIIRAPNMKMILITQIIIPPSPLQKWGGGGNCIKQI